MENLIKTWKMSFILKKNCIKLYFTINSLILWKCWITILSIKIFWYQSIDSSKQSYSYLNRKFQKSLIF
jgi:hypothetical protein